MKLTVIIVNYNVKHFVEQCLRSVERATKDIETEVYVVDNHSRDGSVDYLRERFPNVHVVDCHHNQGFSRANNIAIRQSSGEYVLLLNPDTFVGEEVLSTCVGFLDEHPKAGGLGVKMLKTDGSKAMESRRGLPTPLTAFYKVIGLCSLYPKSKRFGKYYMGYLPWDEAAQIEVVSGAFFMIRRKALDEVGLLDEDYFMYGEDIDLSYRLIKGGWENWYLPANILHYKGESTQKTSFRYVHVFYDAMLIFFRKHYGHLSFLVSLPIKLAIYLKAAVALVQMQTEKVRKSLGFTARKAVDNSSYIFIGGKQMLEDCREIANKYGLKVARFVEASEQTMPDGHVGKADEWHPKDPTFAVYDVDAFSYQCVLRCFENEPEMFSMGTYDEHTGVLITADELYKK
ncbi:MAG: glycosyltransferase family 2 protein [Prevotella sp.]|nr:glycosyltransferase family 2 protein [Prevotella sp.]